MKADTVAGVRELELEHGLFGKSGDMCHQAMI